MSVSEWRERYVIDIFLIPWSKSRTNERNARLAEEQEEKDKARVKEMGLSRQAIMEILADIKEPERQEIQERLDDIKELAHDDEGPPTVTTP